MDKIRGIVSLVYSAPLVVTAPPPAGPEPMVATQEAHTNEPIDVDGIPDKSADGDFENEGPANNTRSSQKKDKLVQKTLDGRTLPAAPPSRAKKVTKIPLPLDDDALNCFDQATGSGGSQKKTTNKRRRGEDSDGDDERDENFMDAPTRPKKKTRASQQQQSDTEEPLNNKCVV